MPKFASFRSLLSRLHRPMPSRRSRIRSAASEAQSLESRTMLAAITATAGTTDYTLRDGDTLTVNSRYSGDLNVNFNGGGSVVVTSGADLDEAAFTATASGTSRVSFGTGSSAEVVRYVGRGGNDALTVRSGAEISTLVFDVSNDRGRIAEGLVNLQAGSVVDEVEYVGSRGRDRLFVSGTVATGNIDALLFGGNDAVRFGAAARVQSPDRPFPRSEQGDGQIMINTGTGNDTVDFRGGAYDNVSIVTGAGQDQLRFLQATADAPIQFVGDFAADLGSSADRIVTSGRTDFVFNVDLDTGSGDDYVSLTNVFGGNSGRGGRFNVDLGNDGANRDVLEVGGHDFGGTTSVAWSDNVLIRETAFNEFQNEFFGRSLSLVGGDAGSTATVRLTKFSTSRDGFTVSTDGSLRMISNLSAVGGTGSVSITGGDNGNFVRLSGGSYGSVRVTTGSGIDRIELTNGAQTSGGPIINTGTGGDTVLIRDTTARNFNGQRGAVTFGGAATRSNRLILRGNDISRFAVNYAGRTVISEPGGNLITSEFSLTENTSFAGDSPLVYDSDDGTSVADFFVDAESAVRLTFRGTVTGTTRIDTGAAADRIRFIGVNFEANLPNFVDHEINTGAGNDIVSLNSSFVAGTIAVNLGSGSDVMDNLFATLGADSDLNGGGGTDFLEEPTGDYTTRNFERFGVDPTAD